MEKDCRTTLRPDDAPTGLGPSCLLTATINVQDSVTAAAFSVKARTGEISWPGQRLTALMLAAESQFQDQLHCIELQDDQRWDFIHVARFPARHGRSVTATL